MTSSELDPSWWTAAFKNAQEPGGFETPELLASHFESALQQADLGDLQHRVLEALAKATSAMLNPENWQEPFTPALQLRGYRSALPSDLDSDQLALLAQVAPLVEQPTLRARIADVAWFYGDRSRVDLVDMAIHAYRACPLDPHTWACVGRDSWRRAFQLAKRRGPQCAAAVREMCDQLEERILGSDAADALMVASLSDLLASHRRVDRDTARQLADKFVTLGSEASGANPGVSRHLEREASAWFRRCDDLTAANDCIARVADTYVTEADQRLATDPSGALVAGHLFEKALAAIRELPRTYRDATGLDARLEELRGRLAETREASLEAMTRIESDPIDLTGYASEARRQISGHDPFEALVRFASLSPLTDPEQAHADAEEQVAGSLARLFARATYTSDGRKVAASGDATAEDDARVWAELVRNFGIRIGITSAGAILPAHETLTFEHRYPLDYVASLCVDSPIVPPGHVELWARGLWHGLNGDYPSAASVLVPQLEHLIRHHLKQRGVYTLVVDDDTGVETEKSLGALLTLSETVDMLGPGMTLELRALLVEPEGANLRNDIAHGLFSDATAWSYATVYAWWLSLRIVVTPLWHMIRRTGNSPAHEPD